MVGLEEHEPERHDDRQHRVRVDDVHLLGGVADSVGNLAAETQPHETLHELVDAEQERQRADDQLAPFAHPAQRLNSYASDNYARGEVTLRGEAHARLTLRDAARPTRLKVDPFDQTTAEHGERRSDVR